MAWDNNEEGPWGRRRPSSPWKSANSNLDDLINESYDKVKRMMGGGRDSKDPPRKYGILFLFGALLLGWAITQSFYTVQEDERGVVLRLGKWVRTENPGLHFCFYPIETVLRPPVMRVNQIESGFNKNSSIHLNPDETLMLTGDENILDVNFTVLWKIKDVRSFLFKVRSPEATIKVAAEAAVREIIAQSPRAYAQTEGRSQINKKAQKLLQSIMDDYNTGVEIIDVQLQKVDAPAPVADAFLDVQRARADEDRLRNEAEAYRNDILPRARGEAQRLLEEAEGYRQSRITLAEGDAARFESLLMEYKRPSHAQVMRKRLYLEAMQDILPNIRKIVVDPKAGSGILPYLPLSEFTPRSGESSR
jgi:membrane protease subunit HflK